MADFFTFLTTLSCGDITFQPFVVLDGQRHDGQLQEARNGTGTSQLTYLYPNQARDDFYLTFGAAGDVTCRRLFQGPDHDFQLQELGFDLNGIAFGPGCKPAQDYFYHNENPRIYEKMAIPVDFDRTGASNRDSGFDEQAGNRWADPGVVHERIGRSPYQPFPAILLSNYAAGHGLVHGTLSQKIFFHNYLVRHAETTLTLQVFSGCKGIDALQCQAGRILADAWYLGATREAADLERIFAGYAALLRQHLPAGYGASTINRDNMVWGSWNDGLFRNISADMILKEAHFLKKHFPAVRWIQVDDGYAVNTPPAHGLGMPYEGEKGVDPKKFPDGLRHFTDQVRATGLRPAVWIGGFCPKHTPIFKEHPEWFINYDYRVDKSAPLDVSLPVVREYIESALDTFFLRYGFEGMKHDFWSYAFEDSHDLLRQKSASGYQWRDWWLKEIRKRIPSDAYLQTGCDIVMGNPFLGEFFTNYRYGIDIGGGNWDFVRTNFLWGVACFATHTSDLFVANSDSVGLFPGLNDTEAMFCLNYCLVTHSMVEIAGKLSEADPRSQRFRTLRKAVCNPNNGQEVFLAGYDYRDPQRMIPPIIYFKTGHFTPLERTAGLPVRSLGLFNIGEDDLPVTFSAETLGLPPGHYLLTDVWNQTTTPLTGDVTFTLEPHGSRLLAVSQADGWQLLDADLKVCGADGQTFTFTFAGEAELLLNRQPEQLLGANGPLPFRAEPGNGHVRVLCTLPAGPVTVR